MTAAPRIPRRYDPLPRPIHAVLVSNTPEREHHASATCWCRPEPLYRDLGTSAVVYRHWPADR